MPSLSWKDSWMESKSCAEPAQFAPGAWHKLGHVLILGLLRLRRVFVERVLHERQILHIEESDVSNQENNGQGACALHVFEHTNVNQLAPDRLDQSKKNMSPIHHPT